MRSAYSDCVPIRVVYISTGSAELCRIADSGLNISAANWKPVFAKLSATRGQLCLSPPLQNTQLQLAAPATLLHWTIQLAAPATVETISTGACARAGGWLPNAMSERVIRNLEEEKSRIAQQSILPHCKLAMSNQYFVHFVLCLILKAVPHCQLLGARSFARALQNSRPCLLGSPA